MDAAASPRGPDLTRTRLAVFDTGGTRAGTAHALELAERDGAAVVIGGTTELEANALAQLAQTRHIAAVLLRAPSAPPALPAGERAMYAVLGPSRDEEYRATLKAAEQLPGERAVIDAPLETEAEARADAGADAAENVATDPLRARCDAQPKTADGTAFPIAVWRTRKVPTIVVLGDARCARRLVAELMVTPTGGVVPYRPHLVLAPSALELAHEAIHFARMVVGAGAVPADEKAPDDLRALWVDQAGPVGWWGALGHDAAVLATAAASSNLPPTTEHSALQKARLATAVRLVAAKGVLWTTTANGFSPAGVVPRTMFVRSFAAGSAARPPWLSASDHPVYK